MKPRITDADIDRLLAARLKATPPDIADRIAARLAAAGAAPRSARGRWWAAWYVWPTLAAAAGVAVLLSIQRPAPPAAPDFETLFALEESLAPAGPLLDPVNRELCAELPLDNDSL